MLPTESPVTPDTAALAANGPPATKRNGSVAGLLSEEDYSRKHDRRILLIRKEIQQGLTLEEQAELRTLETAVQAYLAARFPGPEDLFRDISERARKLGFIP